MLKMKIQKTITVLFCMVVQLGSLIIWDVHRLRMHNEYDLLSGHRCTACWAYTAAETAVGLQQANWNTVLWIIHNPAMETWRKQEEGETGKIILKCAFKNRAWGCFRDSFISPLLYVASDLGHLNMVMRRCYIKIIQWVKNWQWLSNLFWH